MARFLTPRRLLAVAWLVTLAVTGGSLYYGRTVGNLNALYWYQRIFIFPLAIILGEAVITGRGKVHRLVLPFTGLAGGVALYHRLVQAGYVQTPSVCPDCHVRHVTALGMEDLTLPTLALGSVVLIIALTLLAWYVEPTKTSSATAISTGSRIDWSSNER